MLYFVLFAAVLIVLVVWLESAGRHARTKNANASLPASELDAGLQRLESEKADSARSSSQGAKASVELLPEPRKLADRDLKRVMQNAPKVNLNQVHATSTNVALPQEDLVRVPISSVKRGTPKRVSNELRWHGKGTELEVAGFKLRNANVYASEREWVGYVQAADPSEICVHAPIVAPRGNIPDMGYWPWYSLLMPEHRYEYLQWLATGKSTLPSKEGFLFLYFYGLERRLLVDQADIDAVLREIRRLRQLDAPRVGTKDGRSFRQYSTKLLWFQLAKAPDHFDQAAFKVVAELTESWNEQVVPAALLWHAKHQKPIGAELAMHAAKLAPFASQSIVATKLAQEFHELFRTRYTEMFGPGIELPLSDERRHYAYRAASSGLPECVIEIRALSSGHSSLAPVVQLWNRCIEDLRALSRVKTSSGGAVTLATWEAMPPELREQVEHPLAQPLQDILQQARQTTSSSRIEKSPLVPVGELAKLLAVDQRDKLTPTVSRRVADAMRSAGFAIEPDVALTGKSYGWNDPVAVYVPSDAPTGEPSRYLGAACVLQLGMSVAEADGLVDDGELRRLESSIASAFDLTPSQLERLTSLVSVVMRSGSNISAIGKTITEHLDAAARTKVGQLLVAVAAESGGIHNREKASLKKCFRLLGLAAKALDDAIDAVTEKPDADEEFQQDTAGVVGAGAAGGGLKLNRQAIAAILEETREVASLLAIAMTDSEEPHPGSMSIEAVVAAEGDIEQSSAGAATALAEPPIAGPTAGGLSSRYVAFLEVLRTKAIWDRDDASGVAREHNLMLDGAIEAINEWALDSSGVPVVDEIDGRLHISV